MPSTYTRQAGKLGLVVLAFALAVGATQVRLPSASSLQTPSRPGDASATTYSIFDRPAAAGDDVSRWNVRARPTIDLDLGSGRLVHTDATKSVAAVRADKGLCLLQRFADGSSGLSCALRPDEVVAATSYDGAIGLVPDAVQTVTFTLTDGSATSIPVVDNVWKSPVEATKAVFTVPGTGVREVDLMPRSSMPKGTEITDDGIVVPADTPAIFGG
jgi:hypothetical protein